MTEQLVFDHMPALFPRRCPVCGGTWRGYRSKAKTTLLHTYVVHRQRWVKIGKTCELRFRLRDLRAPGRQQYIVCPPGMDRRAPLTLLLAWPGDVEHELHVAWAGQHAAGEWFEQCDDMTDWLEAAGACLPPVFASQPVRML